MSLKMKSVSQVKIPSSKTVLCSFIQLAFAEP